MTDTSLTPLASSVNGLKKEDLVTKTPTALFQHSALTRHSLRKQNLFLPKTIDSNSKRKSVTEKENHGSENKKISNSYFETSSGSPVGIQGIRKRLEQQFSASSATLVSGQEVSPGLNKIQNTPGTLKKRRQELIVKHKDIQNRCDQLGVGGGVTLWPEMEVVRINTKDVFHLLCYASLLTTFTVIIFNKIHGKTLILLKNLTAEIKMGCKDQSVNVFKESVSFNQEVIDWHKFLLEKTETIQRYFGLSVASSHCLLYLSPYVIGMSALVYFLIDNMQAKNRLTPIRIKTWTCLLCIIGTWTVLMGFGLYFAFELEQEAVYCVRQYSSNLGHLVTMQVDLSTYQSVLLYWRGCLLDNNSDGLIRVLGIVTIKDLIFYLQYYSIPIATVLLTPIFKLFISLWTVCGNGEYINKET